ncbi:MAG: AAA family ATPase [Deltaproteobacteria bacterium]|nr:AAA family ATPase [Deltaproteobacteria bacterium]
MMRLKRLDLKAFGPFTERSLEFDSKNPGLHIIFGPNEAGKSSSLRGLKALLYGFHPQTPDNFLHNYDQLLVGGCLENKDGRELIFQRRKKRVNDLLDVDGNPLDIGQLAAFLHGVEPEIFESLYGIDHNRLVEGGNEILAQEGEVGKALFAAGAGISNLRDVIDQLEQEASGLFKPSGSKPEINKAIKRLKELQQEVKAASLAPKEWKELRKYLQDAEAERSNLEKDRDDKNKKLRRLERLEQAIPELASLQVWRNHLAALGNVIILPLDIGERHQQVELAIRAATVQLQKSSDRLKQVEGKRGAISLNKALIEQTDVVDDFHQRLGEYRKGQKDRPERNGMRINLRREAALLLKQVRPDMPLDEVETLRPMLAKKRTVQMLSSRFEAITQQVGQARKQIKLSKQELQEVEKNLAATPDIKSPHDLNLAVKLAHRAGDIDTQINKARNSIEQSKKECLTELKRIGHWSGDLSTLMELALPLSETVQQCEQEYSEIGAGRRVLEKDRKDAAKELKIAKTELKKLEYGGEVPSENYLRGTREKRENGWQLLRRQWLNNEDVSEESQTYDPEKPLPEAYEGLVNQADVIADRLRNEADRVANAANLRAQAEQQQELLTEYDTLGKNLELREKIFNEEWKGTWRPLEISPLSPKEMSGWLTAMEKLRYRVGDLLKKEVEIQNEETRQLNLQQNLLKELTNMGVKEGPSGTTLAPALVFAETIIDEINQQQAKLDRLLERRKKAQKAFDRAEEEDNEAQETLVTWQEQWEKAISGLGLKGEISALEAIDYLEILQTCLDKVKEAGDLQKRIYGIERDAGKLEKEVKARLQNSAPAMMTLPLDQAILQLRASLSQAKKDNTLYDQLTEEFDSLQTEVLLAEKTLKDANEQVKELLNTTKCQKPEELGLIIGRFFEYQKLQDKISTSEATLARIGAGTTVDELIVQAKAVTADELPGQIEFLRHDVEETLNPAINSISQKIGEITNRLRAMDGSARAAEASEKMEQELARIRRLADRYTRVKLSAKILQQEIERYREMHQDPVLQIASRYFAELTLNSFAGLKADVDDNGEPVLVGIRTDGKGTGVNGMSDGTLDQLYLALRLATLEWHMETSEPMPFIVDDILINFDDERSRATLKVLAKLGRKNQVILFTHHGQLVEEARKIEGEDVVVHNL